MHRHRQLGEPLLLSADGVTLVADELVLALVDVSHPTRGPGQPHAHLELSIDGVVRTVQLPLQAGSTAVFEGFEVHFRERVDDGVLVRVERSEAPNTPSHPGSGVIAYRSRRQPARSAADLLKRLREPKPPSPTVTRPARPDAPSSTLPVRVHVPIEGEATACNGWVFTYEGRHHRHMTASPRHEARTVGGIRVGVRDGERSGVLTFRDARGWGSLGELELDATIVEEGERGWWLRVDRAPE